MTATRIKRTARRPAGARKASRVARRIVKTAPKPAANVPVQVLYRMCKPGWAVIVEKTPNAQGTRFVCPFCTISHRVSGPVRGFRKVRRAQWVKFRRVEK
ncbi:MAG: hypothetical protein ACRD50_12925 [Candidatus Acidiferrales bacterium]